MRDYVSPYIEPYYNSHAASSIKKFNQKVYSPSVEFGKQSYQRYGAPRIDEVRAYSQERWDRILKPQIYTAQVQAKQQYDSNLAPHISKASAAIDPYLTSSRQTVSQVYATYLLPSYEASRPYAEKTYSFWHTLVVETGLPYAKYAWSSTTVFFDRIVWPKVRILYGENVEPQLIRIGERLGRYRDGRRLKAVMKDADSLTTATSTSSFIPSAASAVSSSSFSSISVTAESSVETPPSTTPEQEAEKVREKIESELKNWEDRFTKAADKGTEDLQGRVKEIIDRQIESQVHGVGEALVIQLEETSSSEIAKLKKEIQYLVKKFPEEYDEDDLGKAKLSLSRSTRFAGMAVKEKAQALRSWKEGFDQETLSLVSAASTSTLDVIDNIRDLGLQEIGLRWAQMEGVTYKDWSEYNEVKKTFDEWRLRVKAVAHDHEGLKRSKEASDEIELSGMAAAEETAKELSRLKEVGKWKLEAGDATDDFNMRHIPAKVAAGAQEVLKKVKSASEQVVGTSQGTVESAVSGMKERVSSIKSTVSSAIAAEEPTAAEKAASEISDAAGVASKETNEGWEQIVDTAESLQGSVASVSFVSSDATSDAISAPSTLSSEDVETVVNSVSSSASSIPSQASKKVYGGAMAQEVGEQKPILDDVLSDDDDATYSEKMQDIINQAGDQFTDVTKAVSEALMKTTSTQGTIESASSIADEQYSKALAAASSVLYGTQVGAIESATNVASSKYVQAVEALVYFPHAQDFY